MFPIFLAHGIARFDILREKINEELNLPENPLDDELHYFKNIRSYLKANGFPLTFAKNVDFAGSVELRSTQLQNHIDAVLAETGAKKVHIIAHSMGGLDARRMIVDRKMAERVASLTTIGTPHFGTVLADYLLKKGGGILINILQNALRLNLSGFADLTTKACAEFNARAKDAEAKNGVFYQTYASFERVEDIFLPLVGSWFIIQTLEGRNDGLVSVRSQKWENTLIASDGTQKTVVQKDFPLPADHLNQVGWWDLSEAVVTFFGDNLLEQKAKYEQKIKDIYLEIARSLPN